MKRTNRKPPTEAQKAASKAKRQALKALSDELRARYPKALTGLTVNELVESYYCQQTGQTEWSTFHGWRAKGFAVNKGESGFAIWGQPRDLRAGDPADSPEEAAPANGDKPRQFYPLAYLFHAGQVHAIGADTAAPKEIPTPADTESAFDEIFATA